MRARIDDGSAGLVVSRLPWTFATPLIVEPLRTNAWRRPWANSGFKLFGVQGQDAEQNYTEVLRPKLVKLYESLG